MKRTVAFVAILAAAVGCESERVPVYPVEGSAMRGGKPATGWLAVLQADPAPEKSPAYALPQCMVGADGHFRIQTYERADGAPAGKYRLSFVRMPSVPTEESNPETSRPASPRYVHPDPVEVSPGNNVLPTVEIP